MKKAAVIIGVDSTGGGLQKLESASAGAREFASLLQAEGFDIALLTDDVPDPVTKKNLPVTCEQVIDAIESFVTLPVRYELLVVYFSGHGYWQAKSDVWLLSKAPVKPSEAINLRTAEDMAKYSGIPNVVFISDACRSIPIARDGALIAGTEVFPNYATITTRSKVDYFKATTESMAAYEVTIGGKRISVLTAALLEAFKSPTSAIVRSIVQGAETIHVVPNRRLEEYLPDKVNDILAQSDPMLTQDLDINVPSSEDVFIARVRNFTPAAPGPTPPPSQTPPELAQPAPAMPAPAAAAAAAPPPKASPPDSAAAAVARTLSTKGFAMGSPGSALSRLSHDSQRAARMRLPVDAIKEFETEMGIVVTGLAIERTAVAWETGTTQQPLAEIVESGDGGAQPSIVRMHSPKALSVAVQTADQRCAIIAALPGYIAHAAFDERGLANVSYVPSKNSMRWPDYVIRKDQIDELRALVALAVDQGKLVLRTRREANALADQVRGPKRFDPTLGMYAAFALYQAGNDEELDGVLAYMRSDLGADLFDVRLLAQRQFAATGDLIPVVPFCPMLSQSWNLLSARKVQLAAPLQEARRYLCDSLWATFEPTAADQIFHALSQGEILENPHDPRSVPRREEAGSAAGAVVEDAPRRL